MKKILAVTFAACIGGSAYAIPVAESTARLAGKNFIAKHVQAKDADAVLVKAYMDRSETHAAFYIYSVNGGQGFVIVSGDDAVQPILGYSVTDAFPIENMSPEVSYWLNNYNEQISDVIAGDKVASEVIAQKWDFLLSGAYNKTANKGTAVEPLVTTKWDQGTYYNDLCPGTGFSKTPTGCVATAMAQIMKYWNAPTTGSGSYSYTHGTYGALSADFGATSYDWGVMPNTLNSSSTEESVDAVATLMYHCGVAVRMDYSPEGSGAQVIGWGTYPSALKAFKDYFGYKTTISGEYREDYTTEDWITMLKNEIDAGRPVLYAGFDLSFGAGHAFVFSGYDDEDMFHINWGWSGYYNGYFTVDDLNPDGTGIGGGSGTYNDGQQALINIEPDGEGASYNLALNAILDISTTSIFEGDSIAIVADAINTGNMDFMGRYAAALYTASDSVFVEYIGYTDVVIVPQEGTFNHTFSKSAISADPGNYFVKILYRATTASVWSILPDGEGFVNRINITVVADPTSLNNTESLAGNISLYPNPAKTYLNIDLTDFEGQVNSMTIFSTLGAKVYSTQSISANMQVPLSGFAAGVYLVNLSTDKGSVVKRIVVQ